MFGIVSCLLSRCSGPSVKDTCTFPPHLWKFSGASSSDGKPSSPIRTQCRWKTGGTGAQILETNPASFTQCQTSAPACIFKHPSQCSAVAFNQERFHVSKRDGLDFPGCDCSPSNRRGISRFSKQLVLYLALLDHKEFAQFVLDHMNFNHFSSNIYHLFSIFLHLEPLQ